MVIHRKTPPFSSGGVGVVGSNPAVPTIFSLQVSDKKASFLAGFFVFEIEVHAMPKLSCF